jgi:hypothetical protein
MEAVVADSRLSSLSRRVSCMHINEQIKARSGKKKKRTARQQRKKKYKSSKKIMFPYHLVKQEQKS